MNKVDLQEFPCPIPLVKAKSIMAELKEGEDVTFVINHKYRLENLKGMIKAQSQEIIEENEISNEVFSIKVRKKTIRHFENCMVCSKPLEYLTSSVKAVCQYCGKEGDAYIICPDMHYVCDDCHLEPCVEVITNAALAADSKDPIEIAEHLMSLEKISMIGPEHHPIVAASLLTALKNSNKLGITEEKIKEGIKRAKKLPSGYIDGCCTAAMCVGVAVVVITNATCMSDRERSLAHRAAARALEAIALEGGPRCCKSSVRAAIYEAVGFLNEFFDAELNAKRMEKACTYSKKHDYCKKARCRFFAPKIAAVA